VAGRVKPRVALSDIRRKRLFTPEMIKDALAAGGAGWSLAQLADYWGVSERTLAEWVRRNPLTLGAALKRGQASAEAQVATSLLQAAQGRLVKSESLEPVLDEAGRPVRDPETGEPVTRVHRTYQPFNVVAAIFYLCNRAPDRWKNVQRVEIEHSGAGPQNLVLIVAGDGGAERRLNLGEAIDVPVLAPGEPPALPGGNGAKP